MVVNADCRTDNCPSGQSCKNQCSFCSGSACDTCYSCVTTTNVALIVGLVIGGVVVVIVACVAGCCWRKQQQAPYQNVQAPEQYYQAPPTTGQYGQQKPI